MSAPAIPARFSQERRLGAGGAGEVWHVKDRVTGQDLALKVLGEDAGDAEVDALVREAMALSGLEGLGVPRIVAFGATLGDKRRFLVRELVVGESLEKVLKSEGAWKTWTQALAKASAQLTMLHRAGMLHGDIKPANIIVGPDGEASIVDLGLAAPWREGGTPPVGLTPRYAAPELFEGQPLTVRAEVYALGASLSEGLEERGAELPDAVRRALGAIAVRATQPKPGARYPSVEEFESALRLAIGLPPIQFADEAAWPVLGVEAAASDLLVQASHLAEGEVLPVVGPRGAGRTTLVSRLAWTLGVRGHLVATLEAKGVTMTPKDALLVQLEGADDARPFIVVDDASHMPEDALALVKETLGHGGRAIVVADLEWTRERFDQVAPPFEIPPLPDSDAAELVSRAMPSLPDSLRAHLVEKAHGRPGILRAWIKRLRGQAVVSVDEVDAVLATTKGSILPASSRTREDALRKAEKLLDLGRFDEASQELRLVGAPRGKDESVRVAIARARVAHGRGDAEVALTHLDTVQREAAGSAWHRAWQLARARACLRAGRYAEAREFASGAMGGTEDTLTADAIAVHGLAQVYDGDDALARGELERAVALARKLGDTRVLAIALCSLGIALQRTGKNAEARATYVSALASAEEARDASTVATIRLNLSVLAQIDGDLAETLGHLEAAVDMGRRSGALVAVHQALMNLANLDLYLGRYARAQASIEALVQSVEELGPVARADLLGLRADLSARTGAGAAGAALYEECATARAQLGRLMDATEARLEGLLVRVKEPGASTQELGRALSSIKAAVKEGGFQEHQALADLVEGTIAAAAGAEAAARAAFDRAIENAQRSGRKEWAWRTLDARARLAASQGSLALAKRDVEEALAILEEIAGKLPRDLREVFWDDPRRHALRQAHFATSPVLQTFPVPSSPPRSTSVTTMMGTKSSDAAKLAHILDVMRELAGEHDLPRLLAKVTGHAVALLGAERGFVVLAAPDGTLSIHASRDTDGDRTHMTFSRSVAESVVRTGEPVVATRAQGDSRLAEAASVHQLMIQSIACVPIRGAPPEGRPIGALYLETRIKPGTRFEQELPTLAAFADQAAIAIETARLLSENLARTAELARANQDLAAARDQLEHLLGRRTEQLSVARRDLKAARAELRGHFGYAGLVGTSAAMRRLYALIDRVKDTDVSVLVTGESGTGKEVVAKAIHQAGPRAKKPFVGVNCGAIPANLLESELFGHVRGAFTGADRDRKGLFRDSDGGTILLDEVGELPQAMQAGLLRTLQEKTVRPLGSTREEPVDVRIIAATNRDLSQMVRDGTFREDLYYRLNVIQVPIPPLRERKDDIPALVDHFLSIFATRHRRERKGIARAAQHALATYDWPGNVRQLEHVLLNGWLMSEGDEISAVDLQLPSAVASRPTAPRAAEPSPKDPRVLRSKGEFKDDEKKQILAALTSCNWNRVQAAKQLKLPRRTFYRRLKEYGIV